MKGEVGYDFNPTIFFPYIRLLLLCLELYIFFVQKIIYGMV